MSTAAANMNRQGALFRPMRLRILEELAEGDTASEVARRLEVPRQNVNYHLKALEAEGLVELVEERKKGNCLERVVKATARSYLVSAEALGSLANPDAVTDRFSAAYLVAVCGQAIGEVAKLKAQAEDAGKKLPTLTLQTDVRFKSAADRKAFAEELSTAVAKLVSKYHDATAEGGRSFRLVVGSYPAVPPEK